MLVSGAGARSSSIRGASSAATLVFDAAMGQKGVAGASQVSLSLSSSGRVQFTIGASTAAVAANDQSAACRDPGGSEQLALLTILSYAAARSRSIGGATSEFVFIQSLPGVVDSLETVVTPVGSLVIPLTTVSNGEIVSTVITESQAQLITVTGSLDIGDLDMLYPRDSTIVITGTFTNSTGTPVDPTDVVLQIHRPNGTVNQYKYSLAQVTKNGVGNYSKQVVLDTAGEFVYRWTGTGSNPGTNGDVIIQVEDSSFAVPT